MKDSHGWKKWMSALVVAGGAAACGASVSEPIDKAEIASTASPIEGTTLVKDLSVPEAVAWCTWYVQYEFPGDPSAPLPASAEVNDGYTCVGAFPAIVCSDEPTSLCVSHPSVEQCAQNLLRSPCEAPVSELNDCVDSLIHTDTGAGTGGPFARCGDRCGAFRSRASCEHTVVQEWQTIPAGVKCTNVTTLGPGDLRDCRLPVD